jgi:hypothetical protein
MCGELGKVAEIYFSRDVYVREAVQVKQASLDESTKFPKLSAKEQGDLVNDFTLGW